MVNSRILLNLLILTPFIGTSRSNIRHDPTLATINDSVEGLIEQLSTTRLTDFESDFAKGLRIWTDNLDNDMVTTVKLLDSEIAKMIIPPNSSSSAAALLHGFLEASGDSVDKIVDNIVKTAITLCAINLLRTLTTLYVWSSLEQFHWFQAISYKSAWYDEMAWKNNPVPMDWSKHLKVIFKVDNPILLNDILISKAPSENPLVINMDVLLDLIARHYLLEIYLSSNPTSYDRLRAQLKLLAGSESFKILQCFIESETLDNLRFEGHPPPRIIPKDFGFFWMQGYRYLPADYFISVACEYGYDDILDFLHQLSPILKPNGDHLFWAAKYGHLGVLKWTLDRNLAKNQMHIAMTLALNRHLVFEQLQEQLEIDTFEAQHFSDEAARRKQLDVVEWLYERFKVVPNYFTLYDASVEMLKWADSVDPQLINEAVASRASFDGLKWISGNYPHLLSDRVRQEHNAMLINFDKMQWMILQGWTTSPNIDGAAYFGKMEMLEFGYTSLQMKPTESHANSAAQQGHTEILKFIYSIDPSCISVKTLLNAVNCRHLKTAKYLESILDLKGTALDITLWRAFDYGDLELIEWVYQYYELGQPKHVWLQSSVSLGHLHIINWAIGNRFILETDEMYLRLAVKRNQHLILRRLIDYGVNLPKTEDLLKLAFQAGSLKVVRHLVETNRKNAQFLKNEKISIYNYHTVQWLQDNNLWPE